jgi:hypothetical protein
VWDDRLDTAVDFSALFHLGNVQYFTWGRCYDHNFLRFFPIFGEKIGVFLKCQCYDQLFSKFSFVLSQKRQFFCKIFRQKYLKNHNIGPWYFIILIDI